MNEIFRQASESLLLFHGWENVSVAFTTKRGGVSTGAFATLNLGMHVADDCDVVYENRKKVAEQLNVSLDRWVCADQVHGVHIEKVTNNHAGKGVRAYDTAVPHTDGLYTSEQDLMLALCFADCVPLYFFSPSKKLIGLAHAGWKGTVHNIAGEMVKRWEEEGVAPQHIHVVIGPSIGRCCYVVDDRVIEFVQKALVNSPQSLYNETSKGQYALDLKEMNKQLLQQAGVPSERIAVSSYCTSCERSLFFSHRRDGGKTGRMMALIGWR
ncbi:peptidoglycan editing factor PgeF [Anoxybacillus flavithermus]|uniref:peptidoglycan editing factor PgeF n=1 Tax=Anoxybacillus flavithermus TaxID=33934 RepID=UPI001892A0BD|nr:peptidoglycan editing factor PgeF [Anoxybacillus flavithermus]